MIEEKITTEITCSDALKQLTPQAIVQYLEEEYEDKHKELLEAFHHEELIEYMGGIEKVLVDHEEAVWEYFNNMNAKDEL